jgi:hypothetical protein
MVMKDFIRSIQSISSSAYLSAARSVQTAGATGTQPNHLVERSFGLVTEFNYQDYAAAAMGKDAPGVDEAFLAAIDSSPEGETYSDGTLNFLAYAYATFDTAASFPGGSEQMNHRQVLSLMEQDAGTHDVAARVPPNHFSAFVKADQRVDTFALLDPDGNAVAIEPIGDMFGDVEPADGYKSRRDERKTMRDIAELLEHDNMDDSPPMARTMNKLLRRPDALQGIVAEFPDLTGIRDENGLTMLHHAARVPANDVYHDAVAKSLELLLGRGDVEFGPRVGDKQSLIHFVVREVASERIFDAFIEAANRQQVDLASEDYEAYSPLDVIMQAHAKGARDVNGGIQSDQTATVLLREQLLDVVVRQNPDLASRDRFGENRPMLLDLVLETNGKQGKFAAARAVLRHAPHAGLFAFPSAQVQLELELALKVVADMRDKLQGKENSHVHTDAGRHDVGRRMAELVQQDRELQQLRSTILNFLRRESAKALSI